MRALLLLGCVLSLPQQHQRCGRFVVLWCFCGVHRIGLGSFFEEFLDRFDAIVDAHSGTPTATQSRYFPRTSDAAKMCLYATHDTTIMLMLIGMGVYQKHWPPFAANITFELYYDAAALPGRQARGRDTGYFVQVLYNGEPVVLPCAHPGEVQVPLAAFRNMVRELAPHGAASLTA